MCAAAEMLLAIADYVEAGGVRLAETTGSPEDDARVCSRIALALAFSRAKPVVRLRAIFEGWDYARIGRELY
jgi:hypothetical protein